MKLIKFVIFCQVTLGLLISCTSTEVPDKLEVIVNNDNLTLNPNKSVSNYRVRGYKCNLTWHVVSDKDSKNWALKLRTNEEFNCKSFEMSKIIHQTILKEIFTKHNKENLKSIQLPTLASTQPNLSWNKTLSQASGRNLQWLQYLNQFPNNKNSQQILKSIINKKSIDSDFINLFNQHGLSIQLNSVEKVYTKKAGTTYYLKLKNHQKLSKRVLYDAKYFWYSVNQ